MEKHNKVTIREWARILSSDDSPCILKGQAIYHVASFLEDGSLHRIQQVLDAKVVPSLVSLLDDSDSKLHKQCLSMLSILSSGSDSQIQILVQCQTMLEKSIGFLSSLDDDLQLHAVQILANISRRHSLRNAMLKKGIVSPLLQLCHATTNKTYGDKVVTTNTNQRLLRLVIENIKNLGCKQALFHLAPLLWNRNEKEDVLIETLKALTSILRQCILNKEEIKLLFHGKVVSRLLFFLKRNQYKIQMAILHLVTAFFSKNKDKDTVVSIYYNTSQDDTLLDAFFVLLHHSNCEIRRKACSTLFYLFSRSQQDIQLLLDVNFGTVLLECAKDTDQKIRNLLASALHTGMNKLIQSQFSILLRKGLLFTLYNLFTLTDPKALFKILDMIENLVKKGMYRESPLRGIQNLLRLQHQVPELSEKIQELIELLKSLYFTSKY